MVVHEVEESFAVRTNCNSGSSNNTISSNGSSSDSSSSTTASTNNTTTTSTSNNNNLNKNRCLHLSSASTCTRFTLKFGKKNACRNVDCDLSIHPLIYHIIRPTEIL